MLRNEKGFTLLEIIAALTILATGILALVYMFSGGLNQAAQAERYLNGVYLAQQKFSQLELENFNTGTFEGEFENQETYRWQLEVLPYDSPLNDEEAHIQIQEISLRVFWKDQGVEKEVRLVSLKTLGETHVAPVEQLLSPAQITSSASQPPQKFTRRSTKPLEAP